MVESTLEEAQRITQSKNEELLGQATRLLEMEREIEALKHELETRKETGRRSTTARTGPGEGEGQTRRSVDTVYWITIQQLSPNIKSFVRDRPAQYTCCFGQLLYIVL